MKLRYTPQALSELDQILADISVQSPRGARRIQARIQTIANLLTEYPGSGQLTSFRGIRRIIVTPSPYMIFYLIADDEVLVIGIRHGARDPLTMPGTE